MQAMHGNSHTNTVQAVVIETAPHLVHGSTCMRTRMARPSAALASCDHHQPRAAWVLLHVVGLFVVYKAVVQGRPPAPEPHVQLTAERAVAAAAAPQREQGQRSR